MQLIATNPAWHPDASPDDPDAAIDRAGRETGNHPSRFLAKRGTRFCVVPRDEVLCFTSEEGLTTLLTAKHHLWMQPSLSDLEERPTFEEQFPVLAGSSLVEQEINPGSMEILLDELL